jgi:hypothetical protein
MSFWKYCPKCSPTNFLSYLIYNFHGNKDTKYLGFYCNFQKTAQRNQSPK